MRETLVKTEEFKDSPVGRIPKDWDVFSLSKIVRKIKRGPSLAVNNDGVGVRYLTSDNISESGEIDWAVCKHLDIKPELLDSLLSPGDVIINCVNSAAQIGKVSFIDSLHETTTVGFNNFALSLDKNLVVPRFTFYLFSHSLFQRQISATVKPAINQASFSSQDIISLCVPLPSIYEQQRIADILDTVDQTIAHTSSLIAKLKQIKAGLLHDLLTRGLDENGELRDAIGHPEQFKDSPLGRIPKDWDVRPLKALTDSSDSITYGVLKPGEYVSGGIPLLQIQDVIHGEIEPLNLHRISKGLDAQYARTRLGGGEIVMSLVGTIGKIAQIPDSLTGANLHRNLARIPISLINSSRFVFHYLQSHIVQEAIAATTFGSTQSLLNLADLRELLIALPPPLEQQAIAKFIDTHDTRIRKEEAYRDKIKLQKKGLMHDLLTGKVRVKDVDKFTPASDTV
ncbi:restriction endonuclease subunit S [Microcoleus sp. AR_TQ3_B6]|uniref:restriction endonuclease subunit S n=1 Tax=Microcoleus sp. AR_TQ3_B6 TaxID=3055284 RepID=UPI002FD76786